MSAKAQCKYCLRWFDRRGVLIHTSHRHWRFVQLEFAYDPAVWMYRWATDGPAPHFQQLQLPAPNPLTIYSTRPLGRMAAPIPEHRIPKGYTLPYGYARPFERLNYVYRYWRTQ